MCHLLDNQGQVPRTSNEWPACSHPGWVPARYTAALWKCRARCLPDSTPEASQEQALTWGLCWPEGGQEVQEEIAPPCSALEGAGLELCICFRAAHPQAAAGLVMAWSMATGWSMRRCQRSCACSVLRGGQQGRLLSSAATQEGSEKRKTEVKGGGRRGTTHTNFNARNSD